MIDQEILKEYGACSKQIRAGEILFNEGEPCTFYYQVLKGRVKWVNYDDQGREFIQFLVGENESFGELPLFDGEPYAATAVAVEDSTLIRLNKQSFLSLLNDHPEILFEFTTLFSRRIRFKSSLLQSFSANSPEARISSLIKHLSSADKNICTECNQLKLTRQQIADMTGLRVETVIRTMRMMHDKNEVSISRGKVFLQKHD